VTRTKEFKEIHKDIKSGILWGDRLPLKVTHFDAPEACEADHPEAGGISGLKWRLPSRKEYEEAETNGIRSALQNMCFWSWSSSLGSRGLGDAWLFDGCLGRFEADFSANHERVYSVRCVAN
jgi:hypothetical protein